MFLHWTNADWFLSTKVDNEDFNLVKILEITYVMLQQEIDHKYFTFIEL